MIWFFNPGLKNEHRPSGPKKSRDAIHRVSTFFIGLHPIHRVSTLFIEPGKARTCSFNYANDMLPASYNQTKDATTWKSINEMAGGFQPGLTSQRWWTLDFC